MTPEEESRYGFRWGNVVVTRIMYDKDRDTFGRVLEIRTDAGRSLQVRITPKGTKIIATEKR